MPEPVTTKWKTKTGPNAQNNPALLSNGEVVPIVGIEVDVRVLEGNRGLYKETWRQDGNSTSIICDVPWDSRNKFRRDMMGFTQVQPAAQNQNRLLRYLPERNPDDPSQFCVICEMIDAYGIPENSNTWQSSVGPHWPRYKRAVYQCVFQNIQAGFVYAANDDTNVFGGPPLPDELDEMKRYVLWRRRWQFREQKIPGGGFKLADGSNLPLGEVGFRPTSEIAWQATWFQIPLAAVPNTAIRDLAAKVNTAAVIIDGRSNAVETLLFKGVEEHRYTTPAGDQVVDLTYLFGARVETWNFFPNRTGEMVLATHDGTAGGTKLYRSGTLKRLFTPEPNA